MTKPDDVPQDMVEAFLDAIDEVDPFGRDDLDMSPQQYRRYRVRVGLHAAIMAEREACAQVAEAEANGWDDLHMHEASACMFVATAIRNRSQT